MPRIAQFGAWSSPITADLVSAQGARLSEPRYGDNGLYWIESRPWQAGRSVLVCRASDGHIRDITPEPFSVRSRVHEYGGGAVALAGARIYFVNQRDQQIYTHIEGQPPQRLTHTPRIRYGDLEYDALHHCLYAVAEQHSEDGTVINVLASIDCTTGAATRRVSGADFYSTPRLSPDGQQLVWLAWDHPNMPWDGTALWQARVDEQGRLVDPYCVVGGPEESIFQPAFSPRGVLHFVSDRSGWWNIYRVADSHARQIEAVTDKQAEFGRPQWQLNMRTYGFSDPDTIVACFTQDGVWHVAEIANTRLRVMRTTYTVIQHLDAGNGQAVMLAASPQTAPDVVTLDVLTGISQPVHERPWQEELKQFISIPKPLTYATRDGANAHALYYPPHNPQFEAPRKSRPPLVVNCHGGPTAAADAGLNLKIQYWTSRGFGVLDVNYRGSSGYGRAYRQALYGHWGVVDVADCMDGAAYLVECGDADPKRLAIAGGSAGGYTVLTALTFHDMFAVGASLYGLSDLETAMADTHKFESRYGDNLLGPWPQARAIYRQRSPARHAARLSCPVIFFQGLQDKIVPPSQTARMVISLQKRGVPVASVTFADEAHGFRAAEAITCVLESQLDFFARVLGLTPADDVPAVSIHNADKLPN